jgi:chromosome segregation ATPase
LETDRRLFEDSHGNAQAQLEGMRAELRQREDRLADERRDLETRLRQYQADLVRLDRLQGTLDERDKKLKEHQNDCEAKLEQLQSASADLEGQGLQLDEWRATLQQEADQLAARQKEHAAKDADLAQRSAAVEGQQATLAALRTRLERTREEVRGQEQSLDEERARQETIRAELDEERRNLDALRTQLEGEQQLRDQERAQLLERGAVLDAAVSQLRQAQDKLAESENVLSQRAQELDQRTAELVEQEGILAGRLQQLTETQERLDIERQALRERTQELTQTELAREALQEQLRKRSEDLNVRHKALDEKMQAFQAESAGIEARKAEIERQALAAQAQAEAWRHEQAAQAEQFEAKQQEQARRESHRLDQYQKLQQLGRQVAAQRQAFANERATSKQEQDEWLQNRAQSQARFEALRQEAIGLARQLPDVELRAGTALERLTHAREQLRDHLAELHAYVQESREDLENSRSRLQQEELRVQQMEQAWHRGQEEHRLAMVAFRQQMIGWQGQIVDLRRLLAHDESRLARRHAQVQEQAKEVDAASEKLAEKAEALQQERTEVAGKRQEMDRHLIDMREWYRRKLRELAGIDENGARRPGDKPAANVGPSAAGAAEGPSPSATADDAAGEEDLVPTSRDILTLTEPVDAGDRKLGEVLAQLELIDSAALTALLLEARRQRRSLRQVLLASGVVTLYQLALIEAGNVAGLMLGPVRVIDRLRATQHEAAYRVFDPRRGGEALLRHLAEEDMLDAVRPDEFRQRFTQAMVPNPHVAATLEVLDIAGRPAVLQELLSGLASGDWPPLAAAPGVCFRLFTQAALALDTIHKAGLTHGNLGEACLFLTGEGILKIAGAGEPAWLHDSSRTAEAAEPRDDLRALGKIVSTWCRPTGVRKGTKTKPLPDALVAILHRLAADGAEGYDSAAQLLEDLDRAGSEVPPNAEAWERLLRYVREHAEQTKAVRRSA